MKIAERSAIEDVLIAARERHRREVAKDYLSFSPEYLYITNKKSETVKLKQNHVQMELDKVIRKQIGEGKPVRIIILKSRQMGITTDVAGRFTYETTQHENRNALIVAHQQKAVTSIFGKYEFMYSKMPSHVKPLTKRSSKSELLFQEPNNYKGNRKGLNSSISVAVAGSTSIGRGDTYNYVHLSEFGFWKGSSENSPSNQLIGIMKAVPDEKNTMVMIESTANGMNDFQKEWSKAVNGESGFYPLFLPWYIHEEYQIDREDIRSRLGVGIEEFKANFNEYEQWLYDELDLPIERVAWWHYEFVHNNSSNLVMMKQENPSTPEEAFIHSGTPVYDAELVQQRIESLRELFKRTPYREGYFRYEWNNKQYSDFILDDTIEFVESESRAYVRIYFDPVDGTPYVLGGDTKGEGKDEYTATVKDNSTGIRVASVQMQVSNSKPYSRQIYCLGRYFNDALVGIEMNWNTGPIEELERLNYPNQYMRQRHDDIKKTLEDKLGWRTDKVSRPLMIDNSIYNVEKYIHRYFDIPTLHQMLTFVYNASGRPEAMSGEHDDLILSDMICDEISVQQSDSMVVTSKEIDWDQVPEDYKEDYYKADDKWKRIILETWKNDNMFIKER